MLDRLLTSLPSTLDDMPFDPATFEAEVALKLIPTERLPAAAQEALEAGFDGPRTLRMAILEPAAGWAIDQALPPMMEELRLRSISPEEAALMLARQRAQRLVETGEDPFQSMPYFHQLLVAGDYPDELYDLAYFDDEDSFYASNEEKLKYAREALENLLSHELRQKRLAEKRAAWEQEQGRLKTEWPYVLNSPSGRALLKERYIERITYMRPLLWIEALAWIALGWANSSWRTAVVGYVLSMPILLALPLWGEYRRLKRERRDTLLRRGVPNDQI